MRERGKPKWGFRGMADSISITEKQIQAIEKKAGMTLSKDLSERLSDALSAYVSTKEVISNFPRVSQVRAALRAVKDKAKAYAEALEQLDVASVRTLTSQSDMVDIETAAFQARITYHASEDALKNLPIDKGGRPLDLALKSLLRDLIEIYEQAKGKKARGPYIDTETGEPSGPFFKFAYICLTEINCPFHSNEALAKEIKRILKARKRHS